MEDREETEDRDGSPSLEIARSAYGDMLHDTERVSVQRSWVRAVSSTSRIVERGGKSSWVASLGSDRISYQLSIFFQNVLYERGIKWAVETLRARGVQQVIVLDIGTG